MPGQLWGTSTKGGYMYSDELSDVLRMEVKPLNRFRQFCDARDASNKGLHSGASFYWNVYSKIATAGTDLTEQDTIPKSNFTVGIGSRAAIAAKSFARPHHSLITSLAETPKVR